MTIEEAIETIGSIKFVCRTLLPPKEQAALSLGIEALKRIKSRRGVDEWKTMDLLPGETEE